jgi:hypothetical protein
LVVANICEIICDVAFWPEAVLTGGNSVHRGDGGWAPSNISENYVTRPAMGLRLAGKIAIIRSKFGISSGDAEQIQRDARHFVKAPARF